MIIYSPNSIPIISLTVDDESYRYKAIMGDNILHLEFSLTQHVELPVGSYVDWRGTRYELMNRTAVTIQHTRQYDYRINLEGPEAHLRRYRVHAVGDGRLQFEMIGRPSDHIAMVVTNMQEREGADYWIAGDLLEGEEKLISYNFSTAQEALGLIADAYDTEWELTVETYNTGATAVKRKVIHLHKLDYYADDPLHLAYGANAGFSPGVGRLNYGENGQLQRVYVQGGEQNISREVYDDAHLHLPKDFTFDFDGAHFRYEIDGTTYTETDFDADKAVSMETDEWGYSVRLSDAPTAANEGALDLSDIYPKRVGTVTDVRYVYNGQYYTYAQLSALGISGDDWLAVQVDIIDSTIGSELDYSQCLMANDQPLTVIFQTGELMGREFSATFVKAASATRPANRFELVRTNIDGIEVPNDSFRPNAGSTQDTYIVVNCAMPDEYISDPANFEGAEIDMLRSAAKFLYENKDAQFTFKGEVDEMFAKRNWGTTLAGETATVGEKLIVGSSISFSHPQVQPSAVTVRITALKEFVNKPYAPEITLGNETVRSGFGTSLAQMRGDTENARSKSSALERYTKRSLRDALQTAQLLVAALEGYSDAIKPITVQTMQLIAGDESLQFRFVTAANTPIGAEAFISGEASPLTDSSFAVVFDKTTGKLTVSGGANPLTGDMVLQHMTLGISEISTGHETTEYKFWDIEKKTTEVLDPEKAYYVLAKVSATDSTGEIILADSEHPIKMNDVPGYYHLLIGILNSQYGEERSFASVYGFTEVLPGQVTVDVIKSTDGSTYFDLANNVIQGNITFLASDNTPTSLATWAGSMMNDLSSLEYLKTALADGATTIAGGLVMTNILALTDTRTLAGNVMAGVSGLFDSTKRGNGIAAWFGGPMTDHEASPTAEDYAKSLFRFDGSGYLASGGISWNADGSGHIPGISWDGERVILDSSIYISGGDQQLTSLVNAVTQIISWFGEDADGNIYVKRNGNTARGFYSFGFVSAGGVSDSTGGGGGGGAVTIINNGDNTYTIDNGTSVTASNLATAAYVAAAIASAAPAVHTHAISDITGLQDALDEKADEDVVEAALASLQAQIDSVSSRDTFDEIYATVISADMLSAETIYAGNMLGQWEGHEVSYFATASALSALDTRVTALEDLFEIVDGNVHVKNNRGLYSDSFISAGGLSDSGGSGGGGGTAVSWGSVVASDTGTSYGLTVGSVTHNLYTVAGVDEAISSALASYYTQSQISSLLSGYAPLGQDSKIPSAYLPSYVDDVLEYSSVSGFPSTGETGKIYIATDTNKTYRWTGSGYAEISQSLALGETSATAYRGDRGKIAYDHSQTTGNPHGTTFAQINGSLTASQIPNLDWSKITSGKPTTLAGYGITDAYTKTEIDADVVHKAGEEQISGLKIFNGDLMSANYIIGSTSTSYSYLSANNSMRDSEFELCRSDDDVPYLAFGDGVVWNNNIEAGVFINDYFSVGTLVRTPYFRVTDSIGFTGEVADTQNSYLKGLEYDSTHHAWHLRGNFYADGFISAGGLSDSSSTGAVSWGVATSQYTPLSIGNDTRNLSLSGHTHTVSDITDYTSATNALITSALAAYTPSSAIQPLTFGSKSYNGSTAQEITAADLGALTGITSAMVTTALGYTPYDGATNPNGYISSYTNNYLSAVSASGTTITFSRQGLSALTLTLAAGNIPTLTSSKISDFATAANSAITKATIDALGVDAGTLDGHDSTYFGVDANVVHKTGAETIAGVKTFSDSIAVKNFFNGITATNESFVASVSPPITRFSASPESFTLWHDRLGFAGDNIVANEVTTDGETWEAASDTSTLKGLFTFHSTSISILTSAQKGRRITLRETNYSNSQMRWMVFYLAYIGTVATASITIETSADNSTWTTRSTSASFNTWSNIVYCYGNFGAAQYLRITITKTSTSGGVNMSQIRGLTARWGDQGQGSVNSYPYNWDASKNIYPWTNNKQTLGTSSYRWSYVYGVTGNFTTGVFTTAQATTYKFTAEDTDTGNTFTKGLVYDATNHAWHLRGNFYADGFVSAGGLTDGSDDGSVSWGTATAQYTPLTIGDDTRNLSLSGHTHTTSEITDYSTATDALIQAALADFAPGEYEAAFASLQAQIDSLGSRNAYDELRATVFSADILSANTAYLGDTTLSGTIKTSYTTMVTNLNADKVDGYNANGLFTALSNSGNDISISIGGTTKTLTVGYATKAGALNASKTINGTAFDGSANITTAKWGYAQNFYIDDSNSDHRGVSTSVDGSADVVLKLPSTITATLDGNASTATTLATARTINGTSFDGSANITTARWGASQNFYIDDSTSSNRGVSTPVNGSADVVLKLPSRIVADLTGNASTATTANTATTLVTAAGDAYHPVYINSTGAHQITSLNLVNANSLTNGWIAAKCAWLGNNIVINDSSTSGYLGTILFDDTEDSAAELTWDFTNYAFRFSQSVYSTGFVSAGGLSTTSDARLKDNITAIGDYEAVNVLRALQPVSWVWNDKSSNKGEGQGFIAQEVAPLIPNSTLKIGEYYSLKYDSILPYLAKGWQVHETRIDRLEGEVKALREEIKNLRKYQPLN